MFEVPVVQVVTAAARRPGLAPGSRTGGFTPRPADARPVFAGWRGP
jgi:hypothetical protein